MTEALALAATGQLVADRMLLILIGLVWAHGYRIGWRWGGACGVSEAPSRIAIASIVPTSGLLLAVHVLATCSLFLTHGWVSPGPTLALFAVFIFTLQRFVIRPFTPAATGDRPNHPPPRRDRASGAYLVPLGIVACVYLVFLVDALTRYPAGYDAVWYHLRGAATWMQERSINLVVGLLDQSIPENGMIVPCLLAFGGMERLFTVVHLPNAIICGFSVYGLSRSLGAGHRATVLAVCIALSVPMVVFQAFSCYIDLYGASAWLVSLVALVWWAKANAGRARRDLLVLAGLAAGVAVGSKSTFLVLVALLALVVVCVEWRRPRLDMRHRRRSVRSVLVFGLASLVCSGFWFVRGAVQAGNPLYPLAVTIAGQRILPGWTSEEMVKRPTVAMTRRLRHWSTYPWHEWRAGVDHGQYGMYNYGVGHGLGAAYATFVPLGIIAAVLGAIRRGAGDSSARWRLIYLALFAAGFAVMITAFREAIRYAIPIVLLGVPLAALVIQQMLSAAPRRTLLVASLSLAVTGVIAGFKPAHALAGRVRHQVWSRAGFYQIPAMVDHLPPGTRILGLGANTDGYPLMGRHLGNVVITPIHWKLLSGGGTVSNESLRRHDIDYVFLRKPRPEDWSDDLALEIVFDGDIEQPAWMAPKARLYRVMREKLERDPDPAYVVRREVCQDES